MSRVELVVFFRELLGFHEPDIQACFVPVRSRTLRRLRTGDFIWLLRTSLRPDRPVSGIERVQICSLEREPDGSLHLVLPHENILVDPHRGDERILRLIAPRRLRQLISEHPLATAPITP